MNPLVWTFAYAATIAVACAVALAAWRRRDAAPYAAPLLAAASLGIAAWSGLDLFMTLAPNAWRPGLLVAFIPVTQVGIAVYAASFLAVSDPAWRPRRRTPFLLLTVPVIMSVLALTNGAHHLVFASAVGDPGRRWVDWEPGPLVAVHLLWNYAVILAAVVVALRARRHASPVLRRQLSTVAAGAALPVLGNIISLAGPWRNDLPDLSGVFLTGTMALYAYALLHQGLVTLVPIARGAVLDGLTDAVIVTDTAGRVLDANRAASSLAAALAPEAAIRLLGGPAADTFAAQGIPWPVPDGEHNVVRAGGWSVVLDIRTTELNDGNGRPIGLAVVIRDVTEAHNQRAALADANRRLTEQVTTIDLLRAELAEQAVHDELTGLHNRRHLVSVLELEQRRAEAGGRFGVVLLDIDHFKRINDTYGHQAGDEVLKAVAHAIGGAVRDGDTVARYGGEEFVVLLPGSPPDVALVRAEQIRQRCSELLIDTAAGPINVTISAGVAHSEYHGTDGQALLRVADEALYRAKGEGRNRVLVGS